MTGERGKFTLEGNKLVPHAPKKKTINDAKILGDEIIGGIESMVTGKIHYSKSSLRREYKEHGMVEKGNDRLPPRRPPDPEKEFLEIREDTAKALKDLQYDRVPVSERDRELCQRELREAQAARRRRRTRWA